MGRLDRQHAVGNDRLTLLERDHQLAQLDQWWSEVVGGRGRMVVVAGEAGIGKSALARDWVQRRPSTRCLWGACDGLRTPEPFGPFADIADELGGDIQAALVRGDQPATVFRTLVARLHNAPPVVIVIEDVHWADAASLDVLRMIAGRVERIPALVIVSCRTAHVVARDPTQLMIGDLSTLPGVRRLKLPPLSLEAVRELSQPLGIDGATLHRLTGGNPFFVTEVLDSDSDELPATVTDAVLSRAGRLDEAGWALIEVVAVAPPHIELWALREMCGIDLDGLDQALAAGLVRTVGDTVSFRHELARIAVDGQIGVARRCRLHQRVLETLRANGVTEPSRLAHHAESSGDPALVLELAPQAAEHAARRGANREAAAHYEAALRFADRLSVAQRATMYERCSYLSYVTDQSARAVTALEAALECYQALGDKRREAVAWCQLSKRVWCRGDSRRSAVAIECAERALASIEDGPEWAAVCAVKLAVAVDDEDEAMATATGPRALDLAQRFGGAEGLADTLNSLGTMRLSVGHLDGVDMLKHSREIAQQAGLDAHVGRADINLAWGITRNRAYHLDHLLDHGVQEASDSGLELWAHYIIGYRARMELDRGQWSQATESLRLLDRRHSDAHLLRVMSLSVLATVRARRGDPDCWPLLDEATDLIANSQELQYEAPVVIARAEAAWLHGRWDQVAAETQTALQRAIGLRSPWIAGEMLAWRRRAGIVDTISDDLVLAVPYASELEGDHAGAAGWWSAAGCDYDAALVATCGGSTAAMQAALDTFTRLGATPAARIVARSLREHGVRAVVARQPAAPDGDQTNLTPREVEVLVLVAEGLRNDAIAARLFISRKTVGHHLSSIFRKLGVHTRSQAGAEASRRHLIPA